MAASASSIRATAEGVQFVLDSTAQEVTTTRLLDGRTSTWINTRVAELVATGKAKILALARQGQQDAAAARAAIVDAQQAKMDAADAQVDFTKLAYLKDEIGAQLAGLEDNLLAGRHRAQMIREAYARLEGRQTNRRAFRSAARPLLQQMASSGDLGDVNVTVAQNLLRDMAAEEEREADVEGANAALAEVNAAENLLAQVVNHAQQQLEPDTRAFLESRTWWASITDPDVLSGPFGGPNYAFEPGAPVGV